MSAPVAAPATAPVAPARDGFGDQAWFDAWYEAFAPRATRFPVPVAGENPWSDLYTGSARVLRRPWRFLKAPANGHTPEYGWKLAGAPPVELLSRALRAALQASRCHGVEVDLLPAVGDTARLLGRLDGAGWIVSSEERERISVIELAGDWESYWAARSSNLRKSLGKQERQLQRAGHVEFQDSARTGQWADVLEEGLALEAKGWKGQQGSAILHRPAEAAFYRRIAEATAAEGRLRLFSLALDGRMIAFYLTVAEAGTLFWLKGAYDEQHAHYGPAMLLFRWALAACFDDPSLRAARIPGAPEWTARWATCVDPLLSIRAVPSRSMIGLAVRAEALARRARLRMAAPTRGA